jgi:repressor LexA
MAPSASSSSTSASPPPQADLSRRQWQTLQALRTLWESAACPPTREELGAALGVRAQTADFHLRALARKGFVELGRNARAVSLLPPALELLPEAPRRRTRALAAAAAARPEPREVPIIGSVAAGLPILALENHDGSLPLAAGQSADFALRVQGDSMIDVGILDGDLVLVAEAETAPAGSIVVALVGEGETLEATVKAYRPGRGRVVLEAANPRHADLVLTSDTPFTLAGRVVGLWRDTPRSFSWQSPSRRRHGRRDA